MGYNFRQEAKAFLPGDKEFAMDSFIEKDKGALMYHRHTASYEDTFLVMSGWGITSDRLVLNA